MKHALFLSVASLALAMPAHADEAEAGYGPAGDDGRTIIVTGAAVGYKANDTATATRTDTPLLDVPQSVTVVTRERLDDQALRGVGDALRYVPGVTVGQGEGNRDQITLRGQNTTADFFLDGVRDDVQYYRSLYNIERVEVLKGPFALTFGRGGSGGVVNRVQKAPLAGVTSARLTGSADTLGAWDLSADVNAALTDGAALRVNGFYENLSNHRDHFGGERYAVNPYVAVDLGGWQLGLSYEYVNDERVTDRGVPSVATAPGQPNRPVRGQRDTFVGVPGVNRAGLEAHIAKVRLDGELADGLNWSTTVLYGDYDKFYTNVYADGRATADNGEVPIAYYSDPTRRKNLIAQSNLVWEVETGPLAHKVLAGVEVADQQSRNQRRGGTLSSATFNLANPVYPTVTPGALTRSTVSDVDVFSAFVQDQLSLGAHLDLVVGLRYDRFSIEGTDRMANRPFARVDEKWSPRLGLIVKPQENLSFYTSYSRSFLPRSGDQFLTMTTAQADLAPERFTNYEVGGKWDIRPDLNATVAVFRLDRTNATTPNPDNVAQTIDAGTTRTEGVEVALTGRLLPGWQTSAGYTYQDARLKGNDDVRLGQVPRHQLALWNRYDVTRSFGLGLGVIRQSSQFAAIRTSATTTRLPGFTRVDAALYLKPTERFDVQLNVENLLGETYFPDAHNNNNISTGAPLTARMTARIRL